MSQPLIGFGFSGYRSLGDEIIKIAPLKKINLIIGQNNSGKSNIITFLHKHYAACISVLSGRTRDLAFTTFDRHVSTKPLHIRVSFLITSDAELDKYVSKLISKHGDQKALPLLKRVLASPAFADENGVWFTYRTKELKGPLELDVDGELLKTAIGESDWQVVRRACTGMSGGPIERWIPELLRRIVVPPESAPTVEMIPAIRKIGDKGSNPDDYSGVGIIERLARIQNPPATEQQLKHDFESINQFVRIVLEEPEATIEIPYARDTINVHMNGRTLPLDSLGTGIHEVIILASAATILKNSVLGVEEPEIHLHPLLQKKLLHYLNERTSNQYIFTTHSAHLLDAVPAEIFHVKSLTNRSAVTAITSTRERSQACVDLGYRASDILQANCVIWVEGPSDRVYLNHWLQARRPDLVEGIHYSIMFYGGRLLSHLSGVDEDENSVILEDFISLRKLNRNSVILIDSDKSKPRERLNSTKSRLKNEFDTGSGFSWITKGREVENYLNENHLDKCLKEVHPSAHIRLGHGQWANLLRYRSHRGGTHREANKIKVARKYVNTIDPDLSHLDLELQIKRLISFITMSNGHDL